MSAPSNPPEVSTYLLRYAAWLPCRASAWWLLHGMACTGPLDADLPAPGWPASCRKGRGPTPRCCRRSTSSSRPTPLVRLPRFSGV